MQRKNVRARAGRIARAGLAAIVAVWSLLALAACLRPATEGQVGVEGMTNFADLTVDDLTVQDELHITGALWGATAITLSSPSTIRLNGADIALGDAAAMGNMTEIRLSDASQAIALGNPETGDVFLVDVAGQRVQNTALPLLTKRMTAAYTTTHTLDATDTFAVFSNQGATGSVTYNLPAATAGLDLCFYVFAAQTVAIDPAAGDQIHALTDAAGDRVQNNAAGSYLCLLALDATNWIAHSRNGTWSDGN
jgi:hypothetical protein